MKLQPSPTGPRDLRIEETSSESIHGRRELDSRTSALHGWSFSFLFAVVKSTGSGVNACMSIKLGRFLLIRTHSLVKATKPTWAPLQFANHLEAIALMSLWLQGGMGVGLAKK